MSVVVYEMSHSPFCIPVTRALDSLGVAFERVEVPNWDRSAVLELTDGQYYQVPLLKDGQTSVWESSANSQDIARYIEGKWGKGRLFPEASLGIQEILLEHIEEKLEDVTFKLVDPPYLDGIDDVAARGHVIRHKERRFGPGCVDAWRRDREKLRAGADRLLDRFEQMLKRTPYLLGDQPVYTDFALYGIIGNLTYRNWNELSENQTALRDWSARLAAFRYA